MKKIYAKEIYEPLIDIYYDDIINDPYYDDVFIYGNNLFEK